MIVAATFCLKLPAEDSVFKTLFSETSATLRARGLYTLGVQLLGLNYHITLTMLNHHIRRLLAGCVVLKTTL
jgi:hypothetical protein